jgi:multiple sugar transport system substrate-binding protein
MGAVLACAGIAGGTASAQARKHAATSTTSCSVSAPSRHDVVITYWSSGPPFGVSTYVCGFNKQYVGKYFVKFTSIPYATEFAQVGAALSANNAPDIMQESTTPSLYYAYLHLAEPIAPYLKTAKIKSSAFPRGRWADVVVNGVHYGAPVFSQPTMLFYNKALFAAAGITHPPTTKAQFISDAQKLTKSSKRQVGFIQDPGKNENDFEFPSWVYQFGGAMATANPARVLFNSNAAKRALKFEYDLIYKYHVSPAKASTNEYQTMFLQQHAAMTIVGSGFIPNAAAALGSKLGVAVLPQLGKKHADFLGGGYWWVFKKGNPTLTPARRKGIGLFMGYAYRHIAVLAENGLIPAYSGVLSAGYLKKFTFLPVVEQQVSVGRPNPMIPNWGTVTGVPLYNQIDDILLGQTPISSGLSTAASQTASLMQTLPGMQGRKISM